MKKEVVAVLAGILAAAVVGCAVNGDNGEAEIPEHRVACYDRGGNFVEWDDDCTDDGLFESPRPSSGGMQKYGPYQPSPKPSKAAPSPRPSRR